MGNRNNNRGPGAMTPQQLAAAAAMPPVNQMRVQIPSVGNDPAAFEADYIPIGDTVLLRIIQMRQSVGGIELPSGADDGGPKRCQIIAVGPGLMDPKDDGGRRIPMDPELKKDRIAYPQFAGSGVPIMCGQETYYVLRAGQIAGLSKAPPVPLEVKPKLAVGK